MSKGEESHSWLSRIKSFIQGEPKNEEELLELLRDAKLRSLIDTETLAILEGAIVFSKMRVRDIMLPKQQMVSIHIEDGLETLIKIVTESGHSRFPVLSANEDEVLGILHAKDLLQFHEDKETFDLKDICRQSMFVPESKRLDSLLSEFRSTKNHMAIVVDEYGSVAGFVTIEDIIEQIIGDIEDEFDIDEEAFIKTHGNSRYIVKAHMPIEEFNEALHTDFDDESYDTIGGIIMSNFGYLPKQGEVINIKELEFTIINADGRRIRLLQCKDKRPLTTAKSIHKESHE